LGGAVYSADVDVFNQSYGATLTFSLDPSVEAQFLHGVTNLRPATSGPAKGAIYVKAAGNSFGSDSVLNCTLANAAGVSCGDANMDAENTTPYNIVVGALNAGYITAANPVPITTAQTRSSYSTAGSALWISAPGGEFGMDNKVIYCFDPSGNPVACTHPDIDAAMVTTDQSGCDKGYAVFTWNGTTTVNYFDWAGAINNTVQPFYNPNCNYTSIFNGTSSATPVVSGAVAVLLQANPDLTWRDVKYILAATADQVDAAVPATSVTCTNIGPQTFTAVPGWATNGAGFHFHPWYGFGKINLDAAVAMADQATWKANQFGGPTLYASWVDTGYLPTASSLSTAGAGAIPDCNAAGTTPATDFITPTVNFIEAVQVNVCVRHPNVGELQIELINMVDPTHPAVILPGQNGFEGINTSNAPAGTACQLFLVNQFYGTTAASGFQLVAKDTVLSGNTGTLDGWQIRIWGH
jgi:subtilisin-like proprotein convertase family protein